MATVNGTVRTVPLTRGRVKVEVAAIDSLIQAVAIVFSGAYLLSGILAIIGFVNEHPFVMPLLSLNSSAWETTLMNFGLDLIVETWTTVFVAVLRWFAGILGFIGCINGDRELIVVTITLSSSYLLLKLPSTLLHVYAWIVTNQRSYVEKAKIDCDIIAFDIIFVAICTFFTAKTLKRANY